MKNIRKKARLLGALLLTVGFAYLVYPLVLLVTVLASSVVALGRALVGETLAASLAAGQFYPFVNRQIADLGREVAN